MSAQHFEFRKRRLCTFQRTLAVGRSSTFTPKVRALCGQCRCCFWRSGFQHFHILTPDAVVIIVCIGDVHAVCRLPRQLRWLKAQSWNRLLSSKLSRRSTRQIARTDLRTVPELVVDVTSYSMVFGANGGPLPGTPVGTFPGKGGLLERWWGMFFFRAFVNRPSEAHCSGFLPAHFPAFCCFRNRLRLRCARQQRISFPVL